MHSIQFMKSAGVKDEDILHFFNVKIRSVLEYSTPVYTSMLTVENISDIERAKKITLKVVLAERYTHYEHECKILETAT